MTLTQKLMLSVAALIGAFALMTIAGGSVEAATNTPDQTWSWQMDVEGTPKASAAQAGDCASSTIFHSPMAVTNAGLEATGLLGGSFPESSPPCQVVVECTLTHWGWSCIVYIVCP